MEATKLIWMNGEFKPWDEAKVHVVNHTLHYGAGAFEGIRAYKTGRGTAIFRLPEHITPWSIGGEVMNLLTKDILETQLNDYMILKADELIEDYTLWADHN